MPSHSQDPKKSVLIDNLLIIGLGLIGGSLVSGLRKSGSVGRVIAYDHCDDTLAYAMESRLIDSHTSNLAELGEVDVIVMTTPLSTNVNLLPKIAKIMGEQTILTDVGSVKGHIVKLASEFLGDHFPKFVPGHPLAGTENNGIRAASAGLFQDHCVILTPLAVTDQHAVRLVRKMWKTVGAYTLHLDVAKHDDILASTSHLPHILAYTLVNCLTKMGQSTECFEYAAGGFADFTRIASSNPKMWQDICCDNRVAILEVLDEFQQYLSDITQVIVNEDKQALFSIFEQAKRARDNFLQIKKRKASRRSGLDM